MENKYGHTFDEDNMYPYVAHTLNLDNWCFTRQYTTKLGRVDILAIQRHTGLVALVELKTALSSSTTGPKALARQLNGYHTALNLPSALKWAWLGNPPTERQERKLNEFGISVYSVDWEIDFPECNLAPLFADFREVRYWWEFWKHPHLSLYSDIQELLSEEDSYREKVERTIKRYKDTLADVKEREAELQKRSEAMTTRQIQSSPFGTPRPTPTFGTPRPSTAPYASPFAPKDKD